MGTLLKNVPSIIQYWSLRGHKCTFWLTERVQSDLKQKKEQICTIWRGTCSIQSNCSIIGLLVVIVEVFRTIIIIVILLLAFYYWQHLVLAQCEARDYFLLQISFQLSFGFTASFERGVLVLSSVSLEKPPSHKYVEAKGRRSFKAVSGYSLISATQKITREQVAKRCFNLPSLFSSINCPCISEDRQIISCADKWV